MCGDWLLKHAKDLGTPHMAISATDLSCKWSVMMNKKYDKLTEKHTPEIIAQIYFSIRASRV